MILVNKLREYISVINATQQRARRHDHKKNLIVDLRGPQ